MTNDTNELASGQLWVYKLVFRFMLKTNSRGRIANDSDCHAIILISELINSARNRVDVYCKRLSDDVWGSDTVISAIKAALLRGVIFHVAVQVSKDQCKDSRAFRIFAEKCVRVINLDCDAENGREIPVKANFVLVDGKSFRFEPDPDKHKGFAYACNEEMAKQLQTAFYDKIWNRKS